ncbi:MAG: PAS domain-containing protein [Phycisphaeraceae bacterium]|nr:PAS domain-containing protein [Phycisphaeraceae bacterium]
MRATNALQRNDSIRTPPDSGFSPSTEDLQVIWNALCHDSASAVCVLSTSGFILSHNAAASKLLFAKPGFDATGAPFSAFFDEAFSAERARILAEVASSGSPAIVDGLVRGRLLRCSYRPISHGDTTAILLVARLVASDAQAQLPARRAAVNHTGPLEELTEREFEILALIGQGLSTADIASKLARSVKTIEWHRVSLGEKLGVTNRVQLAHVAIAAGLVPIHENPARTPVPATPQA